MLEQKEYWTTNEVRKLLRKKFQVDLSEDQVVRILRGKLGMHSSKPYPVDYRGPENAEAFWENQLELVFSLLREKGLKIEDAAIGFMDEGSPKTLLTQ
jgi:hypothetical protein